MTDHRDLSNCDCFDCMKGTILSRTEWFEKKNSKRRKGDNGKSGLDAFL